MADLISRSALRKDINHRLGVKDGYYLPSEKTLIKAIMDAPTVDAEPVRHGAWWHYEGTLTCTICGAEFDDGIMEYCGDDVPHRCLDCGAIMDGEESEDGEIR